MARPFKDKAIIICHSATYERDPSLGLGDCYYHKCWYWGNQISICFKKRGLIFTLGAAHG